MAKVEDRIAKGKAKMVELFGPRAAEPAGPLFDMAPEFTQLLQEVVFGEVWANPVLETRLRSFITLSALIALDRQPEVRIHLRGALNLGISKEQLIALIIHLAFYAGMPVAVNSMRTAREVFDKWDAAKAASKGKR